MTKIDTLEAQNDLQLLCNRFLCQKKLQNDCLIGVLLEICVTLNVVKNVIFGPVKTQNTKTNFVSTKLSGTPIMVLQ